MGLLYWNLKLLQPWQAAVLPLDPLQYHFRAANGAN